jgi:N-acetylmuramoyl-L-alanine amidase
MLFSKKRVVMILTLLCLLVSSTTAFSQGVLLDGKRIIYKNVVNLYKVEKGDTLWRISKQFGITVNELKRMNGMNSDLIAVGKLLKISQEGYEVVNPSGDKEMVVIRSRSENTVSNLMADSTVSQAVVHAANKNKQKVTIASTANKPLYSDRYWLAKIIEAEAGIESLRGKIAVGAVVLNRVEDDWFPDTIRGVIFQKLDGFYQFSPVGNGRIFKLEPSEQSYAAADRALTGEDPTYGALFFYNPEKANKSRSKFFTTKKVVATIGNHKFLY